MERYDSYKDSGIYFLPKLPSNWEIRKGKYLFKEENRPVRSDDEIVTCFRDGQVTLRKNRRTEGFTNSLKEIGYQGVRKGDLVIHNMDAFAGAIGVSDSDGKATPVYACCTPKSEEVSQYYYCYLLRYLARNGFILSLAKGIRERSTDFRFNDFKELYLPVPTRKEQDAIVTYLDSATSKIDEAIAQQQKMIDLLNERKQIIIDNAITKGVIPNVKTYFTNVDIIGDIPEHWDLIKMKRIAKGFSNGTSLVQIPNGETNYKVSRIETISSGVVNYEKVGYVRYDKSLDRYKMRKNDILISNINSFERIGNSAIYDGEEELYHGMNLLRITPHDINPNFLFLFLRSSFFSSQMKSACKPAINQVSVPSSNVKNMLCPLPPSREQYEIVEFCNKHIGVLDKEIDSVMLQISLLQERKQIIINDVVTGKVKVV